ncbi:conserved hypothetical protein [Tenacibaculum maritimum]|uniref:DUF6046 domain-containing protein n=1 Tax=Tenacibaculum maritimum TaxID=107401 RepID=UPI0012E4EA5B|nr:DUF6046 domain-containing protein [Tenacibaculum maritimum]MCD9582281.1 DUF6046 domain-containing protein [Tenacibaculum maritimum]MCD9636663.1 DUF6046 domain-containing protein [Tenacibaculum maritimum]CAA0144731.1 conserved hypothetical protein [Tenacibaculum maritimum]CAA0193519.1 conserved hypothetical protein [Tenacibaculum maritimum]
MSASVIINLAARYGAAFGINAISKSFNHVVLNKDYKLETEGSSEVFENDKDYNIEYYGEYDKEADKVVFKYDGQELVFSEMLTGDNSNIYAPPLIISFSREKKLIETEASGSDNVVVERWATKSYSIDVRGILIDVENRQYPADKVSQLSDFFEYNNVIKVVGEQFYDKNIDTIYISSISITPVEGFQDTIQFSFSARSIKGVNYTLLKPV